MAAKEQIESEPNAHEKWRIECAFREREFKIKEEESRLKTAELDLRRQDYERSKWRNPLVVAIGAAAFAALGNAVVAFVNSNAAVNLEDRRSEQARILEMIKTGDRASARENLRFLLDAGLIRDEGRSDLLREYLRRTQDQPNLGPVLPTGSGTVVQRPSSEMRVELFHCETTPTGRSLAERANELRPPDSRMWQVTSLTADQNQRDSYQANQNEIRYNANEAAIAGQLKRLFDRALQVQMVLRPNRQESDGYLSVFFCEGAFTGSANAVPDMSATNAH